MHEAHILKGMGLGNKDYLHVACACSIKADYFVTVDKGIIRKADNVVETRIINPVEFIGILEAVNEN